MAYEVTCPYCKQITSQKSLARNYICPYCLKKSYWLLFLGLVESNTEFLHQSYDEQPKEKVSTQ
jgi:hypothetical protein